MQTGVTRWSAILLAIAPLWAQEPQFTSRTCEVAVPVSVVNKAGRPVEDLTAADFLVMNDGRPQVARLISREGQPLPVHGVIVLQTDTDSQPALAKIVKTASVISSYITNDMGTASPSLAAVITTADEVRVAQTFTSSPDALGDTFAKLSVAGSAARLLDGVDAACDLLAGRKETARRVVVLIAGSRDLGSRTRFADVALKAQRNEAVIYSLSYSTFTTAFTQKASDKPPPPDQPGVYNPGNGSGGMNLLALPALLRQMAKLNIAEAFAQTTGGSHQKFTTLHGLETQLSALGTELHNRYNLVFTPPENQPEGYHRLTVTVRKPGEWRIHARAAYWSEPER